MRELICTDANERQIPARLQAAMRRGEEINLTLAELLRRAGVPAASRSTVYRWADGSVDPKLSRFDAVMSALEARLATEENKLRGALTEGEAAA